MTRPVFVTGGQDSPCDPYKAGVSLGVFAQHPGATKKYIRNDGTQRDAEYRETMARMFIQMTGQERALFVQSVPPETRALAQVLCGVATAGSGGTGFIDFLLTNVNESFTEKYQVVETLSDNFIIYLFGQSAPMFSYSGVLLNTFQDDQRVWMTRLYRDVLRGSQLARRRKLLRLRYDSVIVSGVMLNLNMQVTADQEDRSPFSFNFIPTQYVIFTEAVGAPTKLKEPFTPAGAYGLNTAQVADTSQSRVALRAAASDQSLRPRQTEQDPNALQIVVPTGARETLKERVDNTKKVSKTEQKNVRPGGVVPGAWGAGLFNLVEG